MTAPFSPHVSADTRMRELTLGPVLLGIVLGILFAAANAYVGLKVGLTVSASIPVAVCSMAILRAFRRGTILENNMAQTVGSAGESLAAGIIFTLPALYLWGHQPEWGQVFLTSLLGGLLGVLFMIPLRRFLIVQEHENLPYPEGTACAEVLKAGEAGGTHALKVFSGLGLGAAYASLYKVLGLVRDAVGHGVQLGVYRTHLAVDAIPSLLGVGYILGLRVALMMLGGAAVGWIVLVPLIYALGDSVPGVTHTVDELANFDHGTMRNTYIRFIGAGAVTLGGIASLLKTLFKFSKSIRSSIERSRETRLEKQAPQTTLRTQHDLPTRVVVLGGLAAAFAIWLAPQVEISLLGALSMVLFAGIFVTVSSQIVGLVGGSSNPVSGMTITTLIGTSLLLLAVGAGGTAGMVQAISIGAVVCIAACTAGDTSQDLKTGFLLGATPRRQQLGELVGVSTAAVAMASMLPFILLVPFSGQPLLGDADPETIFAATQDAPRLVLNVAGADTGVPALADPEFEAPQANIMKTLIEGLFEGSLPWDLLLIGMVIAFLVELFKIPSLPVAVGLYLPFSLSAAVFVGGFLRYWTTRRRGESQAETGVLMASGLIAGEALIGLGTIFALWQSDWTGDLLLGEEGFAGIDLLTVGLFAGLILMLYRSSRPTERA